MEMQLNYRLLVATVAAIGMTTGPAMAAVDYSSQAVQVTQTGPGTFTFSENGFAAGGMVTGFFSGSDLDSNGELSSFAGEVTDFGMSFSGNSLVAPFSLGLGDLFGLVYELNGGPLGDEAVGALEGILAQAGGRAYSVGPGPMALCNGVQVCASVSGPGSSTGVPEPATWALMIAGFGLAGAAMRRRRIVLG